MDFLLTLFMRGIQLLFICAVIFLIIVGVSCFQYNQDKEFQREVWNSGIPNNETQHDL